MVERKTCIWWVKNDARLSDNEALNQACQHAYVGKQNLLIIAFIEPSILISAEYGPRYYAARICALKALARQVKAEKQQLYFFYEEAVNGFQRILRSIEVASVFAHQETSSQSGYQRDEKVREILSKQGIAFYEPAQQAVIRGLQKRDKRLAQARKPFESQDSLARQKLPRLNEQLGEKLKQVTGIRKTAIPVKNFFEGSELRDEVSLANSIQKVTEFEARETIQSFFYQRGLRYSGGISSPNEAFTAGSRLSVHLAHGTCSLRQVFEALNKRLAELHGLSDDNSKRWRKSLNAFRSRLFWRDHFIQRLETEVEISVRAINPAFRNLDYADTKHDDLMERFFTGRTGFPIIDACMRCLTETGFLNFRMRALVTNFASFGLHLNFLSFQDRLGRLFTDYEPGIHFSQIQMQAGIVGINTVRVYSPLKQLLDQDPEGLFVRRWLPELQDFSFEQISAYEMADLSPYPRPCVAFNEQAKLMKDQIFTIKRGDFGKAASLAVLEKHGSQRTRGRKASITASGVPKPRTKKKPVKNPKQAELL